MPAKCTRNDSVRCEGNLNQTLLLKVTIGPKSQRWSLGRPNEVSITSKNGTFDVCYYHHLETCSVRGCEQKKYSRLKLEKNLVERLEDKLKISFDRLGYEVNVLRYFCKAHGNAALLQQIPIAIQGVLTQIHSPLVYKACYDKLKDLFNFTEHHSGLSTGGMAGVGAGAMTSAHATVSQRTCKYCHKLKAKLEQHDSCGFVHHDICKDCAHSNLMAKLEMHTLRIMDNCQNPFCERPCTWCCQEIQRVETEIKAETPSALKATLSAAEMRRQEAEATLATAAGELATTKAKLLEAEEARQKVCVICKDAEPDHIILPCRHLCLCESCSQLCPDGMPCPVCRADVTSILKAYF